MKQKKMINWKTQGKKKKYRTLKYKSPLCVIYFLLLVY